MISIGPVAKIATQIIASVGVSKVVNDIITNNTNVVTSADAVKVAAGSLVLGSLIAEHASNHVTSRITAIANWYDARQPQNLDVV
jgi:hypothetical protein